MKMLNKRRKNDLAEKVEEQDNQSGIGNTLSNFKKHVSNKAFTLIELLLVTIICGTILALTIPQVGKSFSYLRLKNSALDVAAMARYANDTAIMERKPHRLNFDKETGKYWLTQQVGFDTPRDFRRIRTDIGRDYFLPREVKLESLFFENPYLHQQNFITFYPNGRRDKCKVTLSNKYGKNLEVAVKGIQLNIREVHASPLEDNRN